MRLLVGSEIFFIKINPSYISENFLLYKLSFLGLKPSPPATICLLFFLKKLEELPAKAFDISINKDSWQQIDILNPFLTLNYIIYAGEQE